MVSLVGDTLLRSGPVQSGNFSLECKNGGRPRNGIFSAGHPQHVRHVGAIRIARGGDFFVVAKVIIAVRQAEAGLPERHDVDVRVLRVGSHTGRKQTVGIDRPVGHRTRNVIQCLKGGERLERFLRLGESVFLDGVGIHECIVQIAQLFFFAVQAVVRLRFEFADDLEFAFLAENRQFVKRAVRVRSGGMTVPSYQLPFT